MLSKINLLSIFLLITISNAKFTCTDCKTAFNLIYPLTETDVGFKWVEKQLYQVCLKEEGFGECQGKDNCQRLCNGMIRIFAPEFKYIFSHSSSNHFCHYFGFCSNLDNVTTIFRKKIQKIFPKHSITQNKNNLFQTSNSRHINYLKNFKKTENNSKMILQITDLHLTQYYQNGTITNCGLPVCCYNDSYPINNTQSNQGAGIYGDHHCDSPQTLLTLMLDDIENRFLSKYSPEELIILWTGDTNSHRLWNQTQEENINQLLQITSQIQDKLQKYGHIVISNYGNHDTYPINQFDYPSKQQWLFHPLGLQWGQMMTPYLTPESNTSLLTSGNFVITLPFLANVSIISLNTNYYDDGNYWNILADNTYHQLLNQTGWLNQVLDTLQSPIYLVGHIPLGSTDFIDTAKEYQNILTNHSHKIKGGFFGHHHADQFEILHQAENLTNPILVLWSAPSLVPDNTNPSYRLYEVSNKTGEILNYYQYRLDLPIGQQTSSPIPQWYLAYDYKSEYKQHNLSPDSVQKLVNQLSKSPKLFEKFQKNYFGGLNLQTNKTKLICGLAYARHDLKETCKKKIFL